MSDKMRKEFEVWIISNWPNQSLARFNALHGEADGEYQGFTVQHCWDAWKASRESLVIELSEHFEFDNPGEAVDVLKACREAIEAAGPKVKP